MKNIVLNSALALGLGIATAPSWAQTEQPAQGQATECAAGAQSADCPKPEGSKQDRVAPKGGAATEGSGTTSEGTAQREKPAADAQKPKASEQGQASEPAGGQQAEQPKQPASGTDAEQPAQSGQGEQPKQGEATQSGASSTQNVNITVEQKTEITQIIKEEKVEPITVDVDVSVGVLVPQTVKVKLRPLPPRIVKIVPAYADYLFFLLADGRIVIVEPSTLEIVVILI
ncbi:hypothetical protein HNQ96_005824 [Aminobacter lissarensis]|uniref:DUF1236 domain-containing protein n=1 Tax=Aminobacter carboxidus TaxID=376165 RepID=A0A8E2BGS9_9HYPH|nr:DUF1236 domain-containing protein [Aminobacter lissarensis]MBB6469930.1 hypothetical protein [Aminobacter lissarensis]